MPMNPATISSINSQIGSGSTPDDNSMWKCDLELCTVLHQNCKLCREWTKHHHDDDDTMSFEQAKVSFHTGCDEALVSKAVGLEREGRAAREETEALLREIEESEAEVGWVRRDEEQLQLQVVGTTHEIGGARHSGSQRPSPSDPSRPRKRLRLAHDHTSPQSRSMAPPFATEQGPIHAGAGSGSEQEPIYVGSGSEGGDDTAP